MNPALAMLRHHVTGAIERGEKEAVTVEPPTRVVFRKWRDGSILALFPDEEWSPSFCSSYEHVGQHGGADYTGCIRSTRPAKPEEYASLKRELERIGYVLEVRARR